MHVATKNKTSYFFPICFWGNEKITDCEWAQRHVTRVGVDTYGGPESESHPLEGPLRVFLANRDIDIETLYPEGTRRWTLYIL